MTANQLLLDLEPYWVSPNIFTFLCPCCRKINLTVKNMKMSRHDQRLLLEAHFGLQWNFLVVMCEPDTAWAFSTRNFDDISVTPSLDASRSGHWHGHITKGRIT